MYRLWDPKGQGSRAAQPCTCLDAPALSLTCLVSKTVLLMRISQHLREDEQRVHRARGLARGRTVQATT